MAPWTPPTESEEDLEKVKANMSLSTRPSEVKRPLSRSLLRAAMLCTKKEVVDDGNSFVMRGRRGVVDVAVGPPGAVVVVIRKRSRRTKVSYGSGNVRE